MPTARPWKLSARLAGLRAQDRLAEARSRLRPDLTLTREALLQAAATRLRLALRSDGEAAWRLVAEAYLALEMALEAEDV